MKGTGSGAMRYFEEILVLVRKKHDKSEVHELLFLG
jgi:hypothetical protein